MPGLHKPFISSSLASVILHGTLIAGFSFNMGNELSQDVGVSRFNIQLNSMNSAPEPVVEPVAPQETLPEEKVVNTSPDSDSQPEPEPEPEKVISTPKPAKKKISKIEEVPEPKLSETDVQNQSKFEQQEDIAEVSGGDEQNSADNASAANVSQMVNKVDPIKLWLSELQKRINQHRRYPRQAVKRGLEGDVRIKAIINTDGSLAQAEVLSGHRSFHSNSLRSLKQALPYPPPVGTVEPVAMVFTIHYKLE